MALLRETETEAFAALLTKFKAEFREQKAFLEYLEEYYLKPDRLARWSLVHRQFYHASQDSNMLSESWNNQLKSVHLRRVPNRKVAEADPCATGL